MQIFKRIAAFALTVVFLTACSESEQVTTAHDHEQNHDSEHEHTQGESLLAAVVSMAPDMANTLGINLASSGPVTIPEVVQSYGQIVADSNAEAHLSARFPGEIVTVNAALGDTVEAGQTLVEIESNQSLSRYAMTAPIAGVITAQDAVVGEQAGQGPLFTILNTDQVWAELQVFAPERSLVRIGQPVSLSSVANSENITGTIHSIMPGVSSQQTYTVRVQLTNEQQLQPGLWVNAAIEIAQHSVAVGVSRGAIQNIENSTVVFVPANDGYRVNEVQLGRQSEDWVEVLNGLGAGAEYVTSNSYILKADVEKAGAEHNH